MAEESYETETVSEGNCINSKKCIENVKTLPEMTMFNVNLTLVIHKNQLGSQLS